MSVLVFAETWDGKLKKPTFEAATYAFELAQKGRNPYRSGIRHCF